MSGVVGNPPNRVNRPPGNKSGAISVSPLLVEAARCEPDEACRKLETTLEGLTQAQAEERLGRHGPNEGAREREHGWTWRLLMAARNPLVILLTVLAAVALATEDYRAATVMALMVALGVGLRFFQESRADQAAAKLKAMISVTATLLRDGKMI